MKSLLAKVLTIAIALTAGNAYSQFVDPNRTGISDEILRTDVSNVHVQKTTQTKNKQNERKAKFEIANQYSDKMKVEYVEVSKNNETGKFELVIKFTNYLSSRSVYVNRAFVDDCLIGEIPMETVCFSAPKDKPVEVVIPFAIETPELQQNNLNFIIPFLGFGEIKIVNAPIKWI